MLATYTQRAENNEANNRAFTKHFHKFTDIVCSALRCSLSHSGVIRLKSDKTVNHARGIPEDYIELALERYLSQSFETRPAN